MAAVIVCALCASRAVVTKHKGDGKNPIQYTTLKCTKCGTKERVAEGTTGRGFRLQTPIEAVREAEKKTPPVKA